MIDIVLNAAKIAFSEDARKSASALIDFIRRSPEWQKDFCTLEAKIEPRVSEQAYLLGEIAVEKMRTLQFADVSLGAFRASYTELVTNAFEHGCGKDKNKKVSVTIELNPHYVSLTVTNPKGKKFSVIKCLEEQRAALSRNPSARTGRGLILVRELADNLDSTSESEGVKAIFYRPSVSLKIDEIEDLVIIEVIDGAINPSASRRITEAAHRFLNRNLILDFYKYKSEKEHATELLRSYLDLNAVFEETGKRVVILLNPSPSSAVASLNMLPPAMVAHSWDEALAKSNQAQLRKRIKQLKGS
ncbi:MAG: ATP-binding protein [Chloroflexi bacterium]|nr:ATP-binding protein [Chloroflexota bacterium]